MYVPMFQVPFANKDIKTTIFSSLSHLLCLAKMRSALSAWPASGPIPDTSPFRNSGRMSRIVVSSIFQVHVPRDNYHVGAMRRITRPDFLSRHLGHVTSSKRPDRSVLSSLRFCMRKDVATCATGIFETYD